MSLNNYKYNTMRAFSLHFVILILYHLRHFKIGPTGALVLICCQPHLVLNIFFQFRLHLLLLLEFENQLEQILQSQNNL